jgi:hypothetical protein
MLITKTTFKQFCALSLFIITSSLLHAQSKKGLTDTDKSSLESIIVEKYYAAEAADYADTAGGILPKGAITYRIYVDLKPGYTLQAVYGVTSHELKIGTSTYFFNNKNMWEPTADLMDAKKINESTRALDSWLTMGAATKTHYGILKSDDKDGSIIKRKSLDVADGLIAWKIKPVTIFGLDMSFFINPNKPSSFSSTNGSIAVFGGVSGPTDDNKILIAQLTTNGELSFELNVQVGTPTGGSIQYVAKNPRDEEIKFDELTYSVKK